MARWGRRGILVVVAVLVVAALAGGGLWVRGRDHLEPGSTARTPDTARVVERDFPDPGEPDETATVPYRDGARSTYGLSVRNRGPLTVKVTEIAAPEAPGDNFDLFRVTGVRMNPRNVGGTSADRPFRAFELESGEERYVEVDGVMDGCEHNSPGVASVITSQRVRYSVLGQSLSADVALPFELRWRYGRRSQCPRGG